MSSQTRVKSRIIATEVSEGQRLNFLPEVFGPRLMMVAESLVYKWAGQLCDDYVVALWRFYRLSNGSAYLAPNGDEPYTVRVPRNGFGGSFNPDSFGIVVTLFVYNQLAAMIDERGGKCDALVERYYHLLDFAEQHEQAAAIFRAID